MKSNSYSKATALTLVAAATALVMASWPAVGQGQGSSRRDRFRRDTGQDSTRPGSTRPDPSGRPGSGKSESGRRDASTPPGSAKPEVARAGTPQQGGRITGPVEPNAGAKPGERRSSRPTERPPARRAVQDEQWAKFDIILTRNMFSRDRIPARRGPVVEEKKFMPNPESYFLLKGVVQENKQFIAFVEDKQSGSVLRLHEGDKVARGTIKSLNLDGLEYQLADKTTTVSLGFDLEGGHGAVTAGDLASFSPTAAPAGKGQSTGGQAAPSAGEAEILKRLMEQRKQQLGQ